jgi:template-activating factor I
MSAMIYIDDRDQPVFDFLSAIRVERSTTDPREATIHFDFEENKYFKNSTLTKAFKVKKDAEPLSAEFDFPRNVESSKVTIDWKSDEVNQSKLRPTVVDSEDDFEPGSFFSSFFEQENDDFAVSAALENESNEETQPLMRSCSFVFNSGCHWRHIHQ